MLACARIGAVHSVVFGGFSPEALHGRIEDCASRFVVTADGGMRGGKLIPLKANVDAALDKGARCRRRDRRPPSRQRRSRCARAATIGMTRSARPCPTTAPASRWTPRTRSSSSTRRDRPASPRACCTRPAAMRCGPRPPSIMCSITGPARSSGAPPMSAGSPATRYVVYGPLANGATSLMFEGVPNHPDFSRFWDVVERHKVDIFYTAPTAIRALMREGEAPVKKHDRSLASACSAASASRSTPRPGSGIGASSATNAARSSTPGGRPRPAGS